MNENKYRLSRETRYSLGNRHDSPEIKVIKRKLDKCSNCQKFKVERSYLFNVTEEKLAIRKIPLLPLELYKPIKPISLELTEIKEKCINCRDTHLYTNEPNPDWLEEKVINYLNKNNRSTLSKLVYPNTKVVEPYDS